MADSTDAVTITEEKDRDGLASIMSCKFNGCGQQITFLTSTKTTGLTGRAHWTNNLAAVWGQMTIGGGSNSLEESVSVLGVPVMTKSSFIHTEQVIGKWWWTILEESMITAGKEEKQIAIQKKNSYHGDYPAITVIVDGGWCKRTHKHSYNALSGVGVIFGKETKKLLYVGVRNKFCAVCAKGGDKEHECFKNWSESSSSMESDIILEGFRIAEKQHGLRYTNFIGDGDSSVQSTLRDSVHEWGRDITKQECANHAVKCFRSSLENLVKTNSHYKGRHKLMKSMRKRLASSARCAIIMRSKDVAEKKSDHATASKHLQEDILNCALHCFGSHHKCKADYCKTVQHLNAIQQSATTIPSTDTLVPTDSLDTTLSPLDTTVSSTTSSDTTDDSLKDITYNTLPAVERDVEIDIIDTVVLEQLTAWEDATADDQAEPVNATLDPPVPLDEQMICDIQKIASRLAAKSSQLIGKIQTYIGNSTCCYLCYLSRKFYN